jgi:hypothetical protein
MQETNEKGVSKTNGGLGSDGEFGSAIAELFPNCKTMTLWRESCDLAIILSQNFILLQKIRYRLLR